MVVLTKDIECLTLDIGQKTEDSGQYIHKTTKMMLHTLDKDKRDETTDTRQNMMELSNDSTDKRH